MKRVSAFLLLLLLIVAVQAQTVNPVPIVNLLDRVTGGNADKFVTVVDKSVADSGKDVFVITSADGKPCIKGNNVLAVATGVNWYLNHYAHINLTWNNPTTNLDGVSLPVPSSAEKHTSSADYRYYLNYCTFSYSMAFWTWERWQQEIDWMALHGINMPLVLVGLETVWKNVLTELGYSKNEINEFVAGPGFMAWFAMNNLEGWGGTGAGMQGNPDWWYARQGELCVKILDAMRDYGMSPVLPGYSGMVPNSMRGKQPSWKIIESGTWAGGYTRPDILSPEDTKNFEYMSEIYYRHLKNLMGVSEFYSMDPFHEGGVPTGQVSISGCYNGVMSAMDKYAVTADELSTLGVEKPKWVVQYWQNLPNSSAFASVKVENPDRFIALDLFSDGNPNWSGNHYAGHDFVYCMLHNFGGRTGLHGRMAKTIAGYYAALKKGNMRGVGATPEGIETNPMLYDMLFELPWIENEPNPQEWLREYAHTRYGVESEAAHAAWVKLLNSVHNCTVDGQQGTTEPVVCARPAWVVDRVSSWSKAAIYWDVQDVLSAADLLLSMDNIPEASRSNYEYDVVDVVRQTIVDFAYYLLPKVKSAYDSGNTAEYERLYQLFLQMILDLDNMLATNEYFTLEHWTTMARDITDEVNGTSVADKNWLEWNARTQITVWANSDGNLHDYSNRCWSGLLKDFHYARWKQFFESNGYAPSGGWFKWEKAWTENFGISYENSSSDENGVEVARVAFAKYFGTIDDSRGAKFHFPYGVPFDASEKVVSEAYRGESYSLPLNLNGNVTVKEAWIDLNADLAQSADEILPCNGVKVELPANAVIGQLTAMVTLSDATVVTYKIAMRERITSPRKVEVKSSDAMTGSVAIEGSNKSSVNNTEPVTVVATAAAGYDFYCWVDADGKTVSNKNPYTYYAKEPATFVAKFLVNKWGVPIEDLTDISDVKSYSQYLEKITLARYDSPAEVIYSVDACPDKLFNTLPEIVNVARGSSFDIAWGDNAANGMKYCYLSAYIDLNVDGDFDDDGELVKVLGTLSAQNSAVCDGNVNVLLPYDIPLGVTHMRLRFDGAWKGGYNSSTKAFPAKATANRMIYEIVLNVTEYPEIASLVTVESNNEELGKVSMLADGLIGEFTGTASIASGLEITLKATPLNGAKFICWKDQYGRVISNEPLHKMYAVEKGTYTAVFMNSLVLNGWEFEYEASGAEIILSNVVKSGEGNLIIPNEITVDNEKFTIVGFSNSLFAGNTRLTTLTLPVSLRSIGDNLLQNTRVDGNGKVQIISVAEPVESFKEWRIEGKAFYNGVSYNEWGSGLLASGAEPLAATYNGGFQIYLGKNGNIVMKIGGGNEYSLDNPNCIIDANSNFSFIVKNDAAGNVSVSLTNASGVTGTKSVVAVMNTFSSLSSALSAGTNITSLKIYAGDIPSPFKGCSNLVNIYVSEGNKNYSSVDGVLYNKDATKLIFYPEGRKTAVDAVVSQHKESLTYNIDGVKVGSVVNSGVYIKNGKKVYIDCK
ncbi:MAG: alpha-N-acetylglucosaminidase C-terminal domain-containing protein [Bacteroidaceae bacterium]|nr:alpha-N-acetylglucosaminidase C-terminal domain-containing protein [Bacteroidaceae bacterium]